MTEELPYMAHIIASMRLRQMGYIWLIAVLSGVLALGPALAPGGILHLDFVLLPHAPVPAGFWGLGPELPRRTPLLLSLAWLDPVLGSVVTGKLLVVLCLATAFTGACRLADSIGLPWRLAAGVLYALNPFTLTRLAVGHLFVLAAMALLPWIAPVLVARRQRLGRIYLGALVLALTGVLGGVFALALVVAGTMRGGHWWWRIRAVGVALAAQGPWLAPGLVVWLQGVTPAGSTAFRTDLGGAGGVLRLLAGYGFWQDTFQVGSARGLAVPVLGVGLLLLALIGHRRLDPEVRAPLGVLAGVALGLSALSGSSATAGFYDRITLLPGGDGLREAQRVLPLFLLWLAPAAALGGAALAERWPRQREVVRILPSVLALLLVGPVLWGADGQLHSTRVPAEWAQARDLVRADPGTVLGLPWFQYLDLEVAGGQRVLNPLPLWLGGDVLTSSNPRLPGGSGAERDDPREKEADRLVAASLRGRPVADELAALGVRWIVVLRDGDPVRGTPVGILHSTGLAEDPGLRHVLAGRTIDVFEVSGWRAPVVTIEGRTVPIDPIAGPFLRLAGSGEATWARPGASGWLRGWRSARIASNGLIELPRGDGWLWYWPSVVVLTCYFANFVGAAFLWKRRWPFRNFSERVMVALGLTSGGHDGFEDSSVVYSGPGRKPGRARRGLHPLRGREDDSGGHAHPGPMRGPGRGRRAGSR